MIKLSLIFALLLLFSCTSKNNCEAFDYAKFKIDSSSLGQDIVYTYAEDTFRLKVRDLSFAASEFEVPTFMNSGECRNGYHVKWENETIGFSMTNYFVLTKNGYEYSAYSSGVDTTFYDIKNNQKLIFEMDMYKPSFIQKITFEKGRVVSFKDSLGRVWKCTDY